MVTTNFDLMDMAKKVGINLRGVYMNDEFVRLRLKDGCYIINLRDTYDRDTGEYSSDGHWLGLYIRTNKAYYFDSFGIGPREEIKRKLKNYKVMYNLQQIQNINSSTCGYYVLSFLIYMSKIQLSLEHFVRMFSENEYKNNSILKRFLNSYNITLYVG